LKAAGLLLLADSHSCGLLKEASMNPYMTDSKGFMNKDSNDNNNWEELQESAKLSTELLVYTNSDDVDDFDVTLLRERLQMVDLDMDGSREILVEQCKNHLRSSSSSATTANTSTATNITI
jgi:hypothetical protein